MKEIKLIVLQGIPASGKTTWARAFLSDNHDWIRVSRDDIRRMLGDYWVPWREDLVSDIEETTITQALIDGRNVIVDATNLNPKTISKWEHLVEDFNSITESINESDLVEKPDRANVTLEFKYFHITPEEAIKRDATRGAESVGEKVIMNFWHKYIKGKKDIDDYSRFYLPHNPSLPSAIIVDIDGTVALMKGRSPYDASKVTEDLPNQPVINIVRRYSDLDSVKILFVSGRTIDCEADTRQWIHKHVFADGYDYPEVGYELFMRPSNDYRKDAIIKDEIYQSQIKDKYNVLFVLDDRDAVCAYWRSQGLLCLQVYPGDF